MTERAAFNLRMFAAVRPGISQPDGTRESRPAKEKLRDAARAKDAQTVDAIVKDLGRQTCGTCHTAFRKPLPS